MLGLHHWCTSSFFYSSHLPVRAFLRCHTAFFFFFFFLSGDYISVTSWFDGLPCDYDPLGLGLMTSWPPFMFLINIAHCLIFSAIFFDSATFYASWPLNVSLEPCIIRVCICWMFGHQSCRHNVLWRYKVCIIDTHPVSSIHHIFLFVLSKVVTAFPFLFLSGDYISVTSWFVSLSHTCDALGIGLITSLLRHAGFASLMHIQFLLFITSSCSCFPTLSHRLLFLFFLSFRRLHKCHFVIWWSSLWLWPIRVRVNDFVTPFYVPY